MQNVHEIRQRDAGSERLSTKPERLLRLPEVKHRTGIKSTSHVYDLVRRNLFPRCVRISPRCVAWRESEVERFIQDRIAEADQAAAQGQLGDGE